MGTTYTLMMPSGPLVCATDLSESARPVVELAARLAAALERSLVLAHVTDRQAPPPGSAGSTSASAQSSSSHDRLREQLRTECEVASGFGPQCEGTLLHGATAQRLEELAGGHEAPLLIVGSHGAGNPPQGRAARFFERLVGSTADKVLRHAARPVLVVPPDVAASTHVRSGHWMAGIDESPLALSAAERAHAFAQALGSTVTLVRVVAPEGSADLAEQDRHWARRAHQALDELARTHAPGAHTRLWSYAGLPADGLCAAADNLHPDFLAVGTHGREGAARLVLGSTAVRVLKRARVPVMVVPRAAS